MTNRIELLRAFQYTKEDLDNILNLDEIADFTEADKDFMEEFKKIYELGLNQLESFINKLDEEGKNLDEYSIDYYVNILLNGPLGQYVRILSKDKKYFKSHADVFGINGNQQRSNQNTTVLPGGDYELGCPIDLYNKLPLFVQKTLYNSTKLTEDIFRGSLTSATLVDNTLPLVDKKPQERYTSEPTGFWVYGAIANYCLKDSNFYMNILSIIGNRIFEKVKNYLGDEDFEIYKSKKLYNPFDSTLNESQSKNFELKKDIGEEVSLDLMGNLFDSEEKRKSSLKIVNANKDKEYLLGSNEGQLGS